MEIDQALRLHSQLAHVLLPFWNEFPKIQPLVCSRLSQWRDLQTTDHQFLALLIQDFEANGVSDEELLVAISEARSQPVCEHLDLMFARTEACARKLYFRYGEWTGGETVSFNDEGCNNPPYPDHKTFGAFGVSGNTTPGSPHQDAIVCLRRVPQLLGPPSWASIPYVFCHELLCHASQAAPSSDVDDPFIEGWMDAVAFTVHHKMVKTLFPWHSAAADEEGRRLFEALQTLNPDLNDLQKKARSARIQGVHAARIACKILGRLANLWPGKGRQSLFERLSIQLNAVSAASQDEYLGLHRRFVSNMLAAERDLALGVRRDAALRKWVLGEATAAEVLSFT